MTRGFLFVFIFVGLCSAGLAVEPSVDEGFADEASAEEMSADEASADEVLVVFNEVSAEEGSDDEAWAHEAWSVEERGPEEESVVDSLTEEQKLWVLATCAVITEINRGRHDMLGGRERTEESTKGERGYLKESWDADSSEDVLTWLKWFRCRGSRKEFEDLGAQISPLTPRQMESLREQIEDKPVAKNKVRIVEAYYEALGDKSLTGWDASRCVAMCGWAYVAGYITEEEAWEHMLPAARFIQRTFDSWRDLGDNYFIGNQFFIAEQLDKSTDRKWFIIEELCDDPESPWVTLPWDLDLGGDSDGDAEQEQAE